MNATSYFVHKLGRRPNIVTGYLLPRQHARPICEARNSIEINFKKACAKIYQLLVGANVS